MSNVPAIKGWIQSDLLKTQVQQALPKHLTVDRFMRIAMTAVQKTPKLLNCTKESLFSALITCSELGIEPDGRRAHLIPYGNTCQLIIDYKGLVELVMRSGEISMIHADVVCENDTFEYNMGEIKTHKIDFRKARGEAYAVYAVATLKDGNKKAEVMTRAEVEKIRAGSKAGKSGPWVEHWGEMAKKTVFRRLSKWLPLSPELKENISKDDDQFDPDMEIRVPEYQQAESNKAMADKVMAQIDPRHSEKMQKEEEAEEVQVEEVQVEEAEGDPVPVAAPEENEDHESTLEQDMEFIQDYQRFLTEKQQNSLQVEIEENGGTLTEERATQWKELIGRAYSKKTSKK